MNFLKVFIGLALTITFHHQIFSQNTADHWESIVLPGNLAKYTPGSSAPDVNWKALDFDDATWNDGKCSIGYGDNDDSTVIAQMLTVYLRTTFTVTDTSKITQLVLHVDYDDAFVAYLNGTEIARSNVGIAGSEPAYDQSAMSNHEASMYSGGDPETFNISQEELSANLVEGNNVLAVQVHNVTAGSSDMSCILFLSAGIIDATNDYQPVPAWFTAPPPPPEELTSSNLPIIIINTEGGNNIPDEPKVNAQMNILYNPDGLRNYLTDPYHHNSGSIAIETRGNVTQSFPKKAYGFETRDSVGENRNQKILGLPAENDWILRACYIDKTLMRNSIASNMSRSIGRYAPGYAFCELIINGSYEGVYVLMEKIKWDNNRLNIDKVYPWTTDADSITGGYIYEVAQSGVDFGERRRFKYPKADEINTAQADYIQNYDDNFRSVMGLGTYANPKTGYPVWIDVQSFIDEILVQEACKNSDAYGWSSYFHKDRLRKLSAGPIWDFDQALSNSTFNDGNRTDEWLLTKGLNDVPTFWAKLFNEPTFKYLLKKRWFELRANEFHTDSIVKFIDSTALYLNEAQARNFNRWPVLGVELWRSLPGWDQRDTYQEEVDYMKTWFTAHLEWMDQQLAAVPDKNIIIPDLVISEIMYNPFDGADSEFIEIVNMGTTEVDLTGVFFEKGITFTFPYGEKIKPGEYKVIAANAGKFKAKYGFDASGEYYGQLDNAGEKLVLSNSYGCEIDAVKYNDLAPWPIVDLFNLGSIELTDHGSDNTLAENWALSAQNYGSPFAMAGSTGIDIMLSSNDIDVFPNPVSENLNIRFTQLVKGEIEIKIYDITGKLLMKKLYDNFMGNRITENIGNLSNGHYILKVSNNRNVVSKSIIVNK